MTGALRVDPRTQTVARIPLLPPEFFDGQAPRSVRLSAAAVLPSETLDAALAHAVAAGVLSRDGRTFDAVRNRACHAALVDVFRPYALRARVLHVGCGAGLVLHAAAVAGWDASGTETSPTLAAWACLNLGLDVRDAGDGPLPWPDETFDAALLLDVAPGAPLAPTVEELRRVLRPEGALVVTAPNGEFLERLLAPHGDAPAAYHAEALVATLRALGFRCMRIEVRGRTPLDVLDAHRGDRATCLRIAEILDARPDHSTLGETLEVLLEKEVQ
jgi:SAM-dependent methyltransferase